MAGKASGVSVDLSTYPDLGVIYLAMKLRTLRGIKTMAHGLSPRCTRRSCHTLSRNQGQPVRIVDIGSDRGCCEGSRDILRAC
jgi:hypothetical protein